MSAGSIPALGANVEVKERCFRRRPQRKGEEEGIASNGKSMNVGGERSAGKWFFFGDVAQSVAATGS